jgi:hypothetical protein
MSGVFVFVFIATRWLKHSRPPAGGCYPSAGLIGWEMRAVTAVASGSSEPRAGPWALVGRAIPLRVRPVNSPTPSPR